MSLLFYMHINLHPKAVLEERQNALFQEGTVRGAARAVPLRRKQQELVALPLGDQAIN